MKSDLTCPVEVVHVAIQRETEDTNENGQILCLIDFFNLSDKVIDSIQMNIICFDAEEKRIGGRRVRAGAHGEPRENGMVQAMLDMLDIKYTGAGYRGSAIAMDKALTKHILVSRGINTAEGIMLKRGEPLSDVPLPCIVKPCSGGSSIGVRRVLDRADVLPAVEEAFKYEDDILIESFVNGREITCGVLGDTALPPAEVIPKGGFYDYAHKYQSGLITEICPAELPAEVTEEVQDISLRVFRALGLEVYARMDFIYDGRDFYCLEANTLPGMTPTSHLPQEAKAMGISYPELCMRIIELSLEKYNK